jgi:hypothetical protein
MVFTFAAFITRANSPVPALCRSSGSPSLCFAFVMADLYHYIPEWKQRALIAANVDHIARTSSNLQHLLIYVLVILVVIAISVFSQRRDLTGVGFLVKASIPPSNSGSGHVGFAVPCLRVHSER